MRRLPNPFKTKQASLLCRTVVIILIAGTFQQPGLAQTIQFSSSGTTNNFDSLYDGFISTSPFRFNSRSIRSKASDSLTEKFSTYRGKYNSSLDLSRAFQSKYGEQLDQFKKYRSRYDNDLNKALNQYRSKPNIGDLNATTKLSGSYEKYQQAAIKAKSLADQFLSGKFKLDSGTIFNSKIMTKYLDSIKRTLPQRPIVPFKEVPREELVRQVNDQFRARSKNLKDSVNIDEEMKQRKNWADLNYARIRSEDGSDLKPMATRLVQTELLQQVDSSRIADLKASRMKMKENERSAHEHVVKFQQAQSFWQKSYLEAILSLTGKSNGSAQLSPAWAYHIFPSWSVGAGPNVLINRESSKVKINVGARVLTKCELLHRTIYFQLEDAISPIAVRRESVSAMQHTLMGGGGYVLPFLSPVTLNLSAMYKFYSTSSIDGSSWVFRVGLSTRKRKE